MEKIQNTKVKDVGKWILVVATALGLGAILGIVFTKPQLIGEIISNINLNGAVNSVSVLSPDETKKNELKDTYNQIIQYEMNDDYTALYEFLTPNEKVQLTLSDYVQQRSDTKNAYNLQYSVDNIEVNGDVGIITRTLSYCKIEGCSDSERIVSTLKKKYEYITGKWYHERNDTLYCGRLEPYAIPQEFERALSLIIQRLKQANTSESSPYSEVIKSVRNCLDIQYAASDNELKDAEGVFIFTESGNKDRLQILVSPRYQANDDLLTAILLSHELAHAILYSISNDTRLTCYENEVAAFWKQLVFYAALNEQEKSSLTSRANDWLFQTSGVSPEAFNVLNFFFRDLPTYSSEGPYKEVGKNKIYNYIKGSSFYQRQCGDE